MAITGDTYLSDPVLLYTDGGVLQEFCVPLMSVKRTIINEYRIVGLTWSTRYHDTIKDTQYKLGATYIPSNAEEKNVLMGFWVDRAKATPASLDNKFWLPSWKSDYSVKTIGSTTEINIDRSYSEENNSSLVRHLAIFKTGNLTTPPDYRKVTSFTNVDSTTDKITISSALSGMTTSAIIMNLFYVSFFNDLFKMSLFAKDRISIPFEFIEDQRVLT